jgi:general secretion pathway protein D
LAQNGAQIIVQNGLYRVAPVGNAGTVPPIVDGSSGTAGSQVLALRYASAKQLVGMLEPYVGEGGKITAEAASNALLVTGDAAVRQTLVGLIRAFDIDILSGRSYALFPVGDDDPAKLAGELEKVLQAQAEAPLASIVQVLPMARVNAVLVVSSQPRYIDAANRFFRLAGRVEDATARAWHVYYVQNGQSSDLEGLLQRAFTPGNVSPTPPPPGSTAPGAGQQSLGFGNATGSTPGVGGAAGGISTTGAAGQAGGASHRRVWLGDPGDDRGGGGDSRDRAVVGGDRGWWCRRQHQPDPDHRQSHQQRYLGLCHPR